MHESGADIADGPPVEIEIFDLAVIAVYLIGVVALGCWAGTRRRGGEGAAYFLAGKSLGWPMIGLALFATNISTIHLVSLAQSGYTSGLLYGNFEWMAGFTLVATSLFFAPFYIRAQVATLPDFLEKRYSRGSRDWLAMMSIVSAIVIHIGFSLYTGAIVLEGCLLGNFIQNPAEHRFMTIVILAGVTGIYTIVGGLMAVVVTESVQTVVLLAGAICITLLGLHRIGGWNELQNHVHPVNFSVLRPDSDPTGLSMWAVFLGYPIIGIWYWCCDQTIVQRVLGAKDENHARIGPLFAGFIKILPMFIFVLPGLLCLGLVASGKLGPLPLAADGTPDTSQTYSHLINEVLPKGVKGLVVAALLAALMSTVSGALNSIATLFSYDIYKRWAPDTSEHKLVVIGRVATFVAMLVAIAWSMSLGVIKGTIFQALTDIICCLAPSITAVFLWGVFWRGASSIGALVTLVLGSLTGLIVYVTFTLMQLSGRAEWNGMLAGFYLFLACSGILVVVSLWFPHKHTAESEKLVWRSPLEPLRGKHGWLGGYQIVALLLVVTMIGLYWAFAGDTAYYPATGVVRLADGSLVTGAVLEFEFDDDRLNTSVLTDHEGNFALGTKALGGGVPIGATCRLAGVRPANSLLVKRAPPNDEGKVVVTLLSILPREATVKAHVEDEQRHLAVYVGEQMVRTLEIPLDHGFRLIRATEVPDRYRTIKGSTIEHTFAEPQASDASQESDAPLQPWNIELN